MPNPLMVPAGRSRRPADFVFLTKSFAVLKEHPVNKKRQAEGKMPGNMIALPDAGDRLPALTPLKDAFGINFGTLVEMPVERGIARLVKMEEVELPDATGNAESDYRIRAEKTLEAIQRFDGAVHSPERTGCPRP